MKKEIRLATPLSNEVLQTLTIGDRVLITGTLYTARDAAHQRLVEQLSQGQPLPVDLRGQIIYYVGPTPPKPGRVIGAAGPTSSYRMDSYAPLLMQIGLKGMIGKGPRGAGVLEAIKKYKAVYFAATGGIGALISRTVKASEVVAFEDLGTEAIRRLEVEDFPAVVVNDIHGHDLYKEGRKEFQIT